MGDKQVNPSQKNDTIVTFFIILLLFICPYGLFHFLGEPDFSDLQFRNTLIPKLRFDEQEAVELFGQSRAKTYLNYRVFTLFSGNFSALIVACFLWKKNQKNDLLIHNFTGKGFLFALALLFFLINWVFPTPLSQAGKGGLYSISPDVFSELMISSQVGIYSFFSAVWLAEIVTKRNVSD